ncbi:MAG: transcription elongation factor GreA [Phycisphaerales bacterium]|nr:transcription elongation factor GreA [Phycisphaerales bacterium]
MDIVTAEEKARMELQLAEMHSKRKQITERIAEARALGDLKENAEYHAAREDQGINEAKIREMERRLARVSVGSMDDAPTDMVFVGATVRLREVESDDVDLYRLVGEATGDFTLDYIEVTTNSPLGLALMKAQVGEIVRADLPAGPKRFEIIEILV